MLCAALPYWHVTHVNCVPHPHPPTSLSLPPSVPKARQLESLVRLSEARARIELREEVTAQDAEVSEEGKNAEVSEGDR